VTGPVLVAIAVAGGVPVPVGLALVAAWAAPLPTTVAAILAGIVVVRRRRPSGDGRLAVLAGLAAELRAGSSLRSALWATLGTDPRTAWGRAGRLARLGRPMAEVADHVAAPFGRHGPLVAAALRAASTYGGSGVAVLDAVVSQLRDDLEQDRELRSAVAPARTSALVVAVAPLVLLAWQMGDGALGRALALPGGAVLVGLGLGLVVVGVGVLLLMARRRR
jgi:tight adherence protein B